MGVCGSMWSMFGHCHLAQHFPQMSGIAGLAAKWVIFFPDSTIKLL